MYDTNPKPPVKLKIITADGNGMPEREEAPAPVSPLAAAGAWVKAHPVRFLFCAAGALAIALVCGFGITACNAVSLGERTQAVEEAAAQLTEQMAVHEHVWQPNTELVHVEPDTHEVAHDADYEVVYVPHTVCNVCHEVIDGVTVEHAAATGHEGHTTGVPVPEKHLAHDAWVETVTDEDAHDELVTVSETCALCGETRDVIEDA